MWSCRDCPGYLPRSSLLYLDWHYDLLHCPRTQRVWEECSVSEEGVEDERESWPQIEFHSCMWDDQDTCNSTLKHTRLLLLLYCRCLLTIFNIYLAMCVLSEEPSFQPNSRWSKIWSSPSEDLCVWCTIFSLSLYLYLSIYLSSISISLSLYLSLSMYLSIYLCLSIISLCLCLCIFNLLTLTLLSLSRLVSLSSHSHSVSSPLALVSLSLSSLSSQLVSVFI